MTLNTSASKNCEIGIIFLHNVLPEGKDNKRYC